MKSNHGFTLIEVLVVVAIIAIVAAIAIPQYKHYTEKAETSEVILLADALQKEVISYYALHDRYPTFADLGMWTAALEPWLFDTDSSGPQFAFLLPTAAFAMVAPNPDSNVESAANMDEDANEASIDAADAGDLVDSVAPDANNSGPGQFLTASGNLFVLCVNGGASCGNPAAATVTPATKQVAYLITDRYGDTCVLNFNGPQSNLDCVTDHSH